MIGLKQNILLKKNRLRMNKILSNKYLLLASRVVIGFIFLYAGMEKIVDAGGFASAVNNYKLLPFFTVNIFALILPWIEVVSGLLLILGIKSKENAFILTLLLSVFVAVIAISLLRGLNIDCGCFGTASGTKIGVQKLLENALLILLGLQVIYFGGGRISLSIEY
jgi:uncharacterized membrane protein YphA (DoxX/SURF4 family)